MQAVSATSATSGMNFAAATPSSSAAGASNTGTTGGAAMPGGNAMATMVSQQVDSLMRGLDCGPNGGAGGDVTKLISAMLMLQILNGDDKKDDKDKTGAAALLGLLAMQNQQAGQCACAGSGESTPVTGAQNAASAYQGNSVACSTPAGGAGLNVMA